MTQANRSSGQPDLSIRSAPAPVRRFSKKAVAIVLGGAGLIVLGSLFVAMDTAKGEASNANRELYSTTNKPKAEGLSALPISYADMPEPEPAPILGPPLPGDLGAPILKAQREGRYEFENTVDMSGSVDEAVAQAAIQAERAAAARQSDLFFTNDARRTQSAPDVEPAFDLNGPKDPFEALNALGLASIGQGGGSDANLQDRKEAFLSDGGDRSIYNPHRIETPVSPWQIMAGTVIPASLLTAINSDLPGQVVGQVTEPVYDTVTGQTVLIPQGSRIIGRYDSMIAYGQSRALVVWNRIIMPDGSSIRIDNLPGVDGRGNAGLSDKVDNHTLRIFSAAALSSLISIGTELSSDDDETIARALRNSAQEGASQVGNEVVRRQLSVQPTITVRPGWRLRILVHQDIILQPYGDP